MKKTPVKKKPSKPKKTPAERLISLDAFRGFDILLMIFVNYIGWMKGVPFALKHAPGDMDAYTITDIVFPGFLFIVGVAIPLALAKRMARNEPLLSLVRHIIIRGLALLFLGLVLVNQGHFSAEDTGMSKALWYVLFYLAVIILWKVYSKTKDRIKNNIYQGMKIAAGLLLLYLVAVFHGKGSDGEIYRLYAFWQPAVHSWWGILGMIGWAYMTCSLLYLFLRGNSFALLGAFACQLALYIADRHGGISFLNPISSFVGVGSVLGSTSANVMAGVLVGRLFTAAAGTDHRARLRFMIIFGLTILACGYILRPLHGFSKINATESYTLATSGICCLLLAVFYLLIDVMKKRRWAVWLLPIGFNPLLAYILPDIFNSIFRLANDWFGINLWGFFWPYANTGGLPGMTNGLVMTCLILFVTWGLTRLRIVLKL